MSGETGVCGETAECRIAHLGAHFGEEPSFSGSRGSGTLFFTGCSCRCVFCQNAQISIGGQGRVMSMPEIEDAAMALVSQGVHNLNFVTPDHFLPHVEQLCVRLRGRGVTLPFICNCSGYALPEAVARFASVVDIFLPDFKFADPGLAGVCMGDTRYPDIAMRAIGGMVQAAGFLRPWDTDGVRVAERGVLVRHLVLPGQAESSLAVLRLLRDAFGPLLPISVMSQFRANHACHAQGLFAEPPRQHEYEAVCAEAEGLGFERAYIQPEFGDSDFLPDFSRDEPFRGNAHAE